GSRLLARPLAATLVEGARRRLDAARVRRLLGSGSLALRLTPSAGRLFALAGLEPELVALLERSQGVALDLVLGAAPTEVGLPGAVFALLSAGALELVAAREEESADGDPASSLRSIVEGSAARAEDGTYFEIL